jgi:hypothetical protein
MLGNGGIAPAFLTFALDGGEFDAIFAFPGGREPPVITL